MTFSTFFMSIFLACPLPPSDSESEIPVQSNKNMGKANNGNVGNGNMGAQKGGNANSGQNPSMNGKPGGAPTGMGGGATQQPGGPGGVLMDMEQMKAQKTQEQIASVEHVTISGEITGECTGDLRLDVIGTEDLGGPKDGGEMKGPITSTYLDSVGAFSIVIPTGASVNLSVLCDSDNNKKITADVDKLSLGVRLGVVDADVENVSLTLEDIKPPSGDLPPQK